MKYLKDAKGVALIIEILLVGAVLILVALSVYSSYGKKKAVAPAQTPSPSAAPQASPSVSPSPSLQPTPPPPLTTITPTGGVALQIALPPGWAVLGTNRLTSTIDGVPFEVAFQTTTTDELKTQTYGGDDSLIQVVTTGSGKSLYIIKSIRQSEAYVSLCTPVNGYACSLSQNTKLVLVDLEQYQPTTQSPLPLNFANPATTAALTSFEAIAAGLQL
jgi:hypothetical protein